MASAFKPARTYADLESVDLLYDTLHGIDTFMNAAPPLLITLVLLALVSVPLTLIHEFGHAVVAHDRLGTPVLVAVGSRGNFARFRHGNITYSLSLFDGFGGVGGVAAFNSAGATATDAFWIAAAGPMMSLVGLIVSMVLLSAGPDSGVWHDVMWACTFESFFAIINAVPFTMNGKDGTVHRSDGHVALNAYRVIRATA